MEKYKLIPLAQYDAIVKATKDQEGQNLLETRLDQLSIKTKRKISKLLSVLNEEGFTFNEFGVLDDPPLSTDLLPYLLYAVKGRGAKPVDWSKFLEVLGELHEIQKLLSLKVYHEVKRERRRRRR